MFQQNLEENLNMLKEHTSGVNVGARRGKRGKGRRI